MASKRFLLAKSVFSGLRSFWQSQVSKTGFKVFSKSFGKFGFGFFVRFIFSGKVNFSQSQFFSLGFHKFSALAFWLVSFVFQNKVGLVKNCGACKIKSQKAWFWFSGKRSCTTHTCPTKHAPDAGDSAHISSSFLRLVIFLAGRLRRPRPSAGNASRWAVPRITQSYEPKRM